MEVAGAGGWRPGNVPFRPAAVKPRKPRGSRGGPALARLRRMDTNPAGAGRASEARDALFPALARALLLLAGLVALGWFLFRIQQVVLVGMLVVVLAIAVNAPVTWLERRHGWRRGAALAAVALALAALAAAVGWLLVPRLVREVPGLVEQLSGIAETLAAEAGRRFGLGEEVAAQVNQVAAWATGVARQLWRFADSLVAGAVMAIVVVALVLYVVADPRPLLRGALRATPPRHRARMARALAHGSRMVVAWVAANAILGTIKAAAAFLFLTAMGVPGAALWSLLAFLSALVPQIGFYLMSIPPVVMAFGVGPSTALWTALFFYSLSTLLGNFVAPHVQGGRMKLHPAYILGATVAMGYGFGLLGVLVAAPAAGFLKAFFDAFYLDRQPPDPDADARVDAILARDPDALEGELAV